MIDIKPSSDPRKVIGETWYECLSAAIVAEEYEGGGMQFFVITWDGERKPFTNVRSLNEEGSVITKDEAIALLEETRKRVEMSRATARPDG